MPDDASELPPKMRGLNAITGAMSLIIVLLIVQIWLLTATLESYLAGRHNAALPAMIISGAMLMFCFTLYLFVAAIDKKSGESR